MKVKVPTWAGLVPALLVVSVLGCGGGGGTTAPAKAPLGDNPFSANQVYLLNRGYQDQVGGAPLVPSGAGHLTTEGYAFSAGDGLNLALPLGGAAVETYSAEFLFKLEDVSSYRRVMDLSGLSVDQGLYVYNGTLDFFDLSAPSGPLPAAGPTGPALISNGAWVHVVITRHGDTGHIVGYVNGTQVFDVDDTTTQYSVINKAAAQLWFFKDDGSENGTGVARVIRLYRTPLTNAQVKTLADGLLNP